VGDAGGGEVPNSAAGCNDDNWCGITESRSAGMPRRWQDLSISGSWSAGMPRIFLATGSCRVLCLLTEVLLLQRGAGTWSFLEKCRTDVEEWFLAQMESEMAELWSTWKSFDEATVLVTEKMWKRLISIGCAWVTGGCVRGAGWGLRTCVTCFMTSSTGLTSLNADWLSRTGSWRAGATLPTATLAVWMTAVAPASTVTPATYATTQTAATCKQNDLRYSFSSDNERDREHTISY